MFLGYKHFSLASYVYAYTLDRVDQAQLQQGIDLMKRHTKLEKVYLETHRGLVDVPEEKMLAAKALFEQNGLKVAGGITSTALVGERKPSIFDCFCFSDEAHRERYRQIVEYTARLFDEIILDDYFFTPCRCEKCIEKKGSRSWERYRLDTMTEFSKEIVELAKRVNPRCKFVIKYPNWYESFQETGYDPERQRHIFDGIYTGTESRRANYNHQHLPRYLSYSLIRLLENTAPGRNGGGWIDLGGSNGNLSVWLEQAELTLFARARELMLFNFEAVSESTALPPLGVALERVDRLLDHLGHPVGVPVYEPFNADGEDHFYDYVGMCGIPLEPTPEFDGSQSSVFLTQNSARDPQVMEKLKAYVMNGGVAVVTSGFVRETLGKGIEDMTSLHPTGRKVIGTRYQMTNLNVSSKHVVKSDEPVIFDVLNHKNNATWPDVLLHLNDFCCSILSEDMYGKGYLYVLTVPDNFSDIYRFPREVWGAIAKDFSRGRKFFVTAEPKVNVFEYDNDTFGVYSFQEYPTALEITLLGEKYAGFEDIETGEQFLSVHHFDPQPRRMGDSASCRPEPLERVFRLPVTPGTYRFFRLVKG